MVALIIDRACLGVVPGARSSVVYRVFASRGRGTDEYAIIIRPEMSSLRFLAALLVLELCAAVPAVAAPRADFAARLLAAHNAERATLGLPPLTWSPQLAAQAADWAKFVADIGWPEESPKRVHKDEGENLWMGSTGQFTLEEMMDGWTREKRIFHNGVFPYGTSYEDWRFAVVGHYTQIVWRNTTEVGCGLATSGRWDVLICRYWPAGNVIGEWPY